MCTSTGPAPWSSRSGSIQTGFLGSWSKRVVRPGGSADGLLLWSGHGALSTCGAAYASELAGAEAEPRHDTGETRPLQTTYACRARSRRRYRVRQLTSLVPSTRASPARSPGGAAAPRGGRRRLRARARRRTVERGRELWRARPMLVGAPERWQELVDAAFFYLHTSAHPSSPCSTSMFGLAYWPDYHYYRGHVMWDIETFAVPPLLLTDPDAARAMLGYRIDRLEGAQQNAAANGYRGAQYPVGEQPAHRARGSTRRRRGGSVRASRQPRRRLRIGPVPPRDRGPRVRTGEGQARPRSGLPMAREQGHEDGSWLRDPRSERGR